MSLFCSVTGIRINTVKTVVFTNAGLERFKKPNFPDIRVTEGREEIPRTYQTIKYDMKVQVPYKSEVVRTSPRKKKWGDEQTNKNPNNPTHFTTKRTAGPATFQTGGIYIAGTLVLPVPFDHHWKYLGVWISADLDWGKQHVKTTEATLPTLERYRYSALRPRQVRILINSVIIPRIVYPGTVVDFTDHWVGNMEKQMRITTRSAIRACAGLCNEAIHEASVFCGINRVSIAIEKSLITHEYVRLNTLPTRSAGAAAAADPLMSFAKSRANPERALERRVTDTSGSSQGGTEDLDAGFIEQADGYSEHLQKRKTIKSQEARIAKYNGTNAQDNSDTQNEVTPAPNPTKKRKVQLTLTLQGALEQDKPRAKQPMKSKSTKSRGRPKHIPKQSTLAASQLTTGQPRTLTVNNEPPASEATTPNTYQHFLGLPNTAANDYETSTIERNLPTSAAHKPKAERLRQAVVQIRSVIEHAPKFEQPLPLYCRMERYTRALSKHELAGGFRQSPGKSQNPVHGYPKFFDWSRKIISPWSCQLEAYFSPQEIDESAGLQHLIKHGVTLIDLATNDGRKLRPRTKTVGKLNEYPMQNTAPGTIDAHTYYFIHYRLTEYREKLIPQAISPFPTWTDNASGTITPTFTKGDVIATNCSWDSGQAKWGAYMGVINEVTEDDEGNVYHILGFSQDVNTNQHAWPGTQEKSWLHPESWPERFLHDKRNGQLAPNVEYQRTWEAREIDGITLIHGVAIKRRYLLNTIGRGEAKCIVEETNPGAEIGGYDSEMLGYELALRNRGMTPTVFAVLGQIAEQHATGASPHKTARTLANTWWTGRAEPQPDCQCIDDSVTVLEQQWCQGSTVARFYAHTTLLELKLWLQQSDTEKDPNERGARELTPRRSRNGNGRWTPPTTYGMEALPLPRGVDLLAPQMERNNDMVAKDTEGKYQEVMAGTDGGFHKHTNTGTAASTPLGDQPHLTHAPCDHTIETASPLPYPCESSTEAERVAHIQADITSPQQLPLHPKSDARSATALHKQSVANVMNPNELTVRRQITRKFHAVQSAAEKQMRRRLDHGHPIPTITWVEAHVLGDPVNNVSESEMLAHTINTRADALCEFAVPKTTPRAYYLLGQPDHYLYSTTDGKPLARGPQHTIKRAEPKRVLGRMRRRRRQGQLSRGNTSLPLVSAAAKYPGRSAEHRDQDTMHLRSMTQQLPTTRELARRGDCAAHWVTEDQAHCTVCEPPHPLGGPHLVTCEICKEIWADTRNKIIRAIEKERGKPENENGGEGRPVNKKIVIPDKFPEVKGGKRVLLFLDPKHLRHYQIHGDAPSDHPDLQPRELPRPEQGPTGKRKRGAEPPGQETTQACDDLNSTNPIRTCLGAPPKQLSSLFTTLGAQSKVGAAIWAKLTVPHLTTAVSECLSAQREEWGKKECGIPNCVRCEEGADNKPKRKRKALDAGITQLFD